MRNIEPNRHMGPPQDMTRRFLIPVPARFTRNFSHLLSMRYYIPVLRVPTELPPQSAPEDKLGGMPWGLPHDMRPTCRDCGKSLSLLAQFVHHLNRLDLGRTGRVLNVFQCNHDPGVCSSWEGGSGANACFVTEPEKLTDSLSPTPPDAPPLEREARIVEWLVVQGLRSSCGAGIAPNHRRPSPC